MNCCVSERGCGVLNLAVVAHVEKRLHAVFVLSVFLLKQNVWEANICMFTVAALLAIDGPKHQCGYV